MRDFSIKKLYYSISEVSKITEVEQYVLRYWETEFEGLRPQKNRAGNRAYTNKDIQLILVIKHLLREKKYTIEGAKKIISETVLDQLIQASSGATTPPDEVIVAKNVEDNNVRTVSEGFVDTVTAKRSDIRKELLELKVLLQDLIKIF